MYKKFYDISLDELYVVNPPSLTTLRTFGTRPANSSLCETSQIDLLRLRDISLRIAIEFSTPIVSKPESINSSINRVLIGKYRFSQTSLNANDNPKINRLRSPLDKLSKSSSLPNSVISTFRSF